MTLVCGYLTTSYLLVGLQRGAEDGDTDRGLWCWSGTFHPSPEGQTSVSQQRTCENCTEEKGCLQIPLLWYTVQGYPVTEKRSNLCTSNQQHYWELCQPQLPKGSTHKPGDGRRVRNRFLKDQRLLGSIFCSNSQMKNCWQWHFYSQMSLWKEELLSYWNQKKLRLYLELHKYYWDNHYSFLAKSSIDFISTRKFTSLTFI